MQRRVGLLLLVLSLALVWAFPATAQEPMTTDERAVPERVPTAPLALSQDTLTYQGLLKVSGVNANGVYDFEYRIFSFATGGIALGSVVSLPNQTLSDGIFAATLNFGESVFTGSERWLEIAVKADAEGTFTILTPRQPVTAAPQALALPGFWTQQTTSSPNLIGGDAANVVGGGVVGATISGGGSGNGASPNLIYDNFGTVAGGTLNQAGTNDGNPATEIYATVGGGNNNGAIGTAATVSGGDTNVAGGVRATVGGGTANTASGINSTVAGGFENTAGFPAATVGGGENNIASATSATVSGGTLNTAIENYATVGGGSNNNAGGINATVGGGSQNIVYDHYGTVGGGALNRAGGNDGNPASHPYTTVSGGNNNTASFYGATVGGGENNTASGRTTTVGGGQNNTANSLAATVSGGQNNTAIENYATVSGGGSNTASSSSATVGGGVSNEASELSTTVGGGSSNNASAPSATVGGGNNNNASGYQATVCGGGSNTASGTESYACGGAFNVAAGEAAGVLGGRNNRAGGAFTLAAGEGAIAAHDGAFVWAGIQVKEEDTITSTAPGQFVVRAPGGAWFGSGTTVNIPDGAVIATESGAYLTQGGTWANSSDRALKTGFAAVNSQQVLEQVAQMPITAWNYTNEGEAVQHIGPTAQDFYSAFGLGSDDKHITTVDADGVALAAIQGLYEQNQSQAAHIQVQATEISMLSARVTLMEQGYPPASLLPWLGMAAMVGWWLRGWVRKGTSP